MLKKFMYGIKSEKRHQLIEPDKLTMGRQLALSMEVDGWGVCSITSR